MRTPDQTTNHDAETARINHSHCEHPRCIHGCPDAETLGDLVQQRATPALPPAVPCWFCSHKHTEPDICRAVAIDGGPCVCRQDPASPPAVEQA